MNTSPIQSSANITQNLISSSNQLDGAASDTSFNQFLSREIADRNNAENANAAPVVPSAPAAPAAPSSAAAAPVASSGKAPDAGTAKEASDKTKDGADAAPDAASVEMLALVQANAVPLDPRTLNLPSDGATVGTTALDASAIRTIGVKKGAVPTDADVSELLGKMPNELAGANNLSGKSVNPDPLGRAELLGKTAQAAVKDLPAKTAVPGMQILQAKGLPDAKPEPAGKSQPAAVADLQSKPQAGNPDALLPVKSAIVPAKDQTENLSLKDAAKPGPNAQIPANELKPGTDLGTAIKTLTVTGLDSAKTAETPAAMSSMIQQATLGNAQVLTSQASDKLTPPVGSPGWDQALGQKVTWMAAGGMQSASLTLNPPDLGPLQVVLSVTNSHADATFIAAQPEVRQALEAAMPKLREMMSDNGIQLGQTTVSTGMPNQNQFSPQGDQAQQASRQLAQSKITLDAAPVVVRPLVTSSGQGMIDTFA